MATKMVGNKNGGEATEKAKGKQAPPWVIGIVALVLIGFFYFEYQANFGLRGPAPLSTEEKDKQDIIADIVKRSGGDMSKVTPEDMATLRKIAGNFAGMAYNDVKKKRNL